MRLQIISLILLLSIGLLAGNASVDSNITIKDIKIYGTERIKISKLLGIIGLEKGDPYTDQLPESIEKILADLAVFESIEIEKRRIRREVILIISLKEKAGISIGPEIEMNAVDPDYWSEENENNFFGFGMALTDYSLERKSISLEAGVGSQDRIALRFAKRMGGNVTYGLETGYNHFKTRLSMDSQLDKIWVKSYIRKAWRHLSLKLWGEYSQLWEDLDCGRKNHKYWRLGGSAVLDFRNNPFFPNSGIFFSLGAYRTWNRSRQLYDSIRMSVSTYIRGLSMEHSLAISLNSDFNSGDVPMLNWISEGGYRTIRGITAYDQVFKNGIFGSIEYRIPIGSFKQDSPIFFASSLYLYSDVGLFADQVKNLTKQDLKHASGIGYLWQIGRGGAIRFDLTLYPKVRFTIGSAWKF